MGLGGQEDTAVQRKEERILLASDESDPYTLNPGPQTLDPKLHPKP